MLEQPRDAPRDSGAPKPARVERHGDRLADRAARIERRARILEHHLHRPAASGATVCAGEIASRRTGWRRARRREARGSCGRSSICRSRFRPRGRTPRPWTSREADVARPPSLRRVDAPEQPAAHREGLGEADDFEQGLAHAAASSRRQQAALWPGPTGRSSGGAVAACAIASGQRGAKRQPGGGARVVGQRPVDPA